MDTQTVRKSTKNAAGETHALTVKTPEAAALLDISKQPLLIKTPDAAALLGISKRSLQNLVKTRQIASMKIGKSLRFAVADIEKFIAAARREAVGWKGDAR